MTCMACGRFIAFFSPSVCVGGGDYGILLSRSITWLVGPKIQEFIDNYKPDYWSLWLLTTPMKQQNLLQNHHKTQFFLCFYTSITMSRLFICVKKIDQIFGIFLLVCRPVQFN